MLPPVPTGAIPPPATLILHPWPILAHNAKEVPKRWLFTRGVEISPSGRFVVVIQHDAGDSNGMPAGLAGSEPQKLSDWADRHLRQVRRRLLHVDEFGPGDHHLNPQELPPGIETTAARTSQPHRRVQQ